MDGRPGAQEVFHLEETLSATSIRLPQTRSPHLSEIGQTDGFQTEEATWQPTPTDSQAEAITVNIESLTTTSDLLVQHLEAVRALHAPQEEITEAYRLAHFSILDVAEAQSGHTPDTLAQIDVLTESIAKPLEIDAYSRASEYFRSIFQEKSEQARSLWGALGQEVLFEANEALISAEICEKNRLAAIDMRAFGTDTPDVPANALERPAGSFYDSVTANVKTIPMQTHPQPAEARIEPPTQPATTATAPFPTDEQLARSATDTPTPDTELWKVANDVYFRTDAWERKDRRWRIVKATAVLALAAAVTTIWAGVVRNQGKTPGPELQAIAKPAATALPHQSSTNQPVVSLASPGEFGTGLFVTDSPTPIKPIVPPTPANSATSIEVLTPGDTIYAHVVRYLGPTATIPQINAATAKVLAENKLTDPQAYHLLPGYRFKIVL